LPPTCPMRRAAARSAAGRRGPLIGGRAASTTLRPPPETSRSSPRVVAELSCRWRSSSLRRRAAVVARPSLRARDSTVRGWAPRWASKPSSAQTHLVGSNRVKFDPDGPAAGQAYGDWTGRCVARSPPTPPHRRARPATRRRRSQTTRDVRVSPSASPAKCVSARSDWVSTATMKPYWAGTFAHMSSSRAPRIANSMSGISCD
jgi:hypothetical protein